MQLQGRNDGCGKGCDKPNDGRWHEQQNPALNSISGIAPKVVESPENIKLVNRVLTYQRSDQHLPQAAEASSTKQNSFL